MKRHVCIAVLSTALCILTGIGSAGACSVFSDTWDPADVIVDSDSPYYFTIMLPHWDLGRSAYREVTLDLTYYDQNYLDIMLFAADPASDTGAAANYGILLGTVPWPGYGSVTSGTARFNLLTQLDESTFNALFTGQDLLYIVADCSYVFDRVSLGLEANPVPVPPALVLMGSGMLGLAWLKRRRGR